MVHLSENSPEFFIKSFLYLADIVLCVNDCFSVEYYSKKNHIESIVKINTGFKNLKEHFNELGFNTNYNEIEIAVKEKKEFSTLYCQSTISSIKNYLFNVAFIPELNSLSFITIKLIEEKPLKEVSDERWRLALDTFGDGVWELNLKTRIMRFSQKWHNIFGFKDSEVTTLEEWVAHVHSDDHAKIVDNFTKYSNGEIPYYSNEIRYLDKENNYKWILSRGIIVEHDSDGEPLIFLGTHTDIHKNKIADEAHRINLGMLLKLVNSLPYGLLVTDDKNSLVFANKAFANLYKLDKHPRELRGLDAEVMLQSDKLLYKNPQQLTERIRHLLTDRKMVLGDELEMVDGKIISRDYIPTELSNNHKGDIWRFTEITDKKIAERKYKEQRAFYEHILNCIPANIAVFDKNGIILYVNPNGIKNEEIRNWVIGKTLLDYCKKANVPDEIIEERLEFYNTAIKEKRAVGWDEEITSKSGKIYHQYRFFSPVFNEIGQLDMMIAYGVDITDRVKAERALNTSMTAMANSFNHSGIAKALIGMDGSWIEVNDKLCELTGYNKQELYKLNYKELVYHEDLEIDSHLLLRLKSKEIPAYSVEKRYTTKSRQIVYTSLTVSLVWENDSTPKYFICDIVDISKQKKLNEEITRKNSELEATGRSLSNKIKQLEELNHIIAHNLRGPANNIRMLSDRLVMNDNDPAVEEEPFTKDEAGEIIHESSIKLINSLNTLMELMQIRLNTDIPYEVCNFENIIKDISTQLYSVIYEKQAIITLILNEPNINYPKVYLESILYNLFSNALKYNKPNMAPEIIIETLMVNDKIQLKVRDNGLGIDLEKFGSKMFKLNQVFHRGYDSKGVGLYLTKNQIESLGGSIEVNSKVNEGCEFIVTF